MLQDFIDSVVNLSNKLPQWNSDNIERRVQSSISSLFEEAGEISGLISKYRTRKNYYGAETRKLENFDYIRTKFIDETGDFLWVLVCSANCLNIPTNIYELLYDDKKDDFSLSLEIALFDVIRDITLLQQQLMFGDDKTTKKVIYCFEDLFISFRVFLRFLAIEYSITLENIMQYNMEKLNVRYDDKGQRLDNK